MLPGVIRSGSDLKSWGNYKKGDIFAVNLSSNKSAIAIGLLSNSSYDLYMCGGRGVAVNVLHVFGDKLWGMEPSMCMQPPIHGVVQALPTMDDFPALGAEKVEPAKQDSELLSSELQNKLTISNIAELNEIEVNPDDVLKEAFLNSLKLNGKKLALPLLTSTFYPQYVQAALESPIDIKKTTYKKVGTFLKQMANEGFIVIKEEHKGVEKIVSVNIEHPDLLSFRPRKVEKSDEPEETKSQLLLTKMTEVYVVTEKTSKLFANFNHLLGDKLDEKQVKDHVKVNFILAFIFS